MQLQNVLYFLVWAGLFFVMMRFGCGAHVMGHGHHHGGTSSDARGPGSDPRSAPPDRVVDPVCGRTIETARAKSTVDDGRVYYFCSQDCREKFEAAPTSYVKAGDVTSHGREKHHGC